MASSKKGKKNSSSSRKREPYQRQASIENAGARIASGMLFIILGACTAVSYFVQEGTMIVGIRKFMSGILGYGFWALAVCFIWVAVIIFQGNSHSGLRIVCILLIPILFSAFIDLLSYEIPLNYSSTDISSQANVLFKDGQNFKCGGVLSGLLVMKMVHLLSKIGTGIIVCILLIICVAMAVSEPQAWYGASPKKSGKNSKSSGKGSKSSQTKASASGVSSTLGTLWNGESGRTGRSSSGRFDPSSLIRMNDDNGGDTLYDLRFSNEEKELGPVSQIEPDDYPEEIPVELPKRKSRTSSASSEKPVRQTASDKDPDLFSGLRAPDSSDSGNLYPAKVSKKTKTADAYSLDSDVLLRGNRKSSALLEEDDPENMPVDLPKRKPRVSSAPAEKPVRPSGRESQRPEPEEIPYKKADRASVRDNDDYLKSGDNAQDNDWDNSRELRREGSGQSGRPIPEGERKRTAASSRNDIKEQKQVTAKEARSAARSIASQISKNGGDDYSYYEYPPSSLLRAAKSEGSDSEKEIYENKIRLENALHSFGVNSSVVKMTHGPTVTRYDIELEQGVKLTKVTNLSNDLALALGVSSVRIAPIPDEISTVGIEVPNKIINTVSLKELIESENFTEAKSRLSFAIGKDIGGNAIIGNISKLPHMLIAGTTGSGKSVCMNSLIISLLYKAKPDEVKFIMIDPKMVELGIYNSIPHLYVPVVTEPKKAAGALQWSVVEMLKRYRLFSEAGVRDLETYNTYCKSNGEQPLPQVVIVIDELADLMMAASKEVEESICRIAQMGRAAGMHLVIATQRPSADVITGLMKANIPSRIAFAVSSALESRIILDQAGADKLIGHGDMLYAPIGCGKPLRVQGAFVSDEEREKIIKFISAHSSIVPQANDEINQFMDKAMEGKGGSAGSTDTSSASGGKNGGIAEGYDEMLPDAVEVVLEMKSCSVSMLQRRIKLGYSRAARIVDQMEELGIVGPYEGAKPRSVVITRDEWNEIKTQKLGLSGNDDYAVAAEMSE
ncbi:MAG: DNA translocase FtsK [Eubacteriales bacterium]|nr:DNA translocase FtsK [Eubacteriales bacterium]